MNIDAKSTAGLVPTPMVFLEITRPFTLMPPFLGIVSGSLAAIGSMAATGKISFVEGLRFHWPAILMGGIMASVLNAASNVLNQVTEIQLDGKNKPNRVLPQGRMTTHLALLWSVCLYALALAIAWMIEPLPGVRHTFWCALVAAIATVIYSAKPFYMKARGWLANITIALPRGCLLKVAGWGCVASTLDPEPWFIGFVFMLFLLGAASSKDFSDYEGDKADGLRTLPVIYGMIKTTRLIAPFFILPWLAMIMGVFLHRPDSVSPVLHANPVAIIIMGMALAGYGVYIAHSMRNLSALSIEGNHPAWKHMYIMMMAGQIGIVICYLI